MQDLVRFFNPASRWNLLIASSLDYLGFVFLLPEIMKQIQLFTIFTINPLSTGLERENMETSYVYRLN